MIFSQIYVRIFPSLVLVAALVCANGCSTLDATNPSKLNIREIKSFYVIRQDGSDLDRPIEDAFSSLGCQVASGSEATIPPDVGAIVTFDYGWYWDMSMYLLRLGIQIRDPRTKVLLAQGKAYHPSLERESPQDVAYEILLKIFDEKDKRHHRVAGPWKGGAAH